ncbi:MAG TPA: glycosyltransferase [Candidatus Andersenbacteria bacterium]|nr:glycosyltransferase [Candidatus Andersenbacteria bacterium]
MNPQIRKQYVVIVHFGSPATTRAALAALDQSTSPADNIVIIDHAQQPLKALSRTIIRPPGNRGYAGGINCGLGALLSLGATESDIVTVMNNDLIVAESALAEVAAWWRQHPGDQLVGAAIDENAQQITTLSSVNLFTGRAQIGHRPHRFTLPYLHGAFLSAPYQVFLRLQGLPEQYFMYWEDVLFSRRLTQQGIPLRVNPRVHVRHQTTSASAAAPDKVYYLVRNGALFLAHETPQPWRAYWRLANTLRWVYHRIRGRSAVVTLALRDARDGITGPRPASPAGGPTSV